MIRGPLNEDCCHNVELFADDDGLYTPIPYDFDFAGMVNAPYAKPNPKFRIDNVRVHYYRGRCRNNELLEGTVAHIRKHEDEIRALVDDLDGLGKNYQQGVTSYLDIFFDRVSTPQNIERYIAKKCS